MNSIFTFVFAVFFSGIIYAHEWDQFIGCYEGALNSDAKMSVSYSDKDPLWSSADDGQPLKAYSIWIKGLEKNMGSISSVFVDAKSSVFFRNSENDNEYHYDFTGTARFLGESIWRFSKHSSFTKYEDNMVLFENNTYLFIGETSEVHKFNEKMKFKRISTSPCEWVPSNRIKNKRG